MTELLLLKTTLNLSPVYVRLYHTDASGQEVRKLMKHRSTVITSEAHRPVVTSSIHRELVRTYWNHRQLIKRYQAGQLTKEDQRIEFNARALAIVSLSLRDLLGIAKNVTYINQH